MNSEWAEQPRSGDQPDTPGMQLRAGREAMGWSIEQVADQIKLAPRQVVALEEGDADALPNLAVVRGFVRAYAKVLKLDAAPLVAMIEVDSIPSSQASPARREISASFSEARFPSLTQRPAKRHGWLGGAALVVVAAAAFGAYQMGLISPALLSRSDKSAPVVPAAPPIETTLVKPEQLAPVPLISIPGPTPGTPATPELPAMPPVPAMPAVPAEVAPLAGPAPAAVAGNALVLSVREDSWVEIRRNGAAPMISRMVTAGNTVTFDITEPVLLIVGRPRGVDATLRGEALQLASAAGTTTARLNIK